MLDGFGFAKSVLPCALAAVCIVCSGSADATDYTYQKIVGPNGEPVYPAVINNAGQIAGGYYTADKHVHGFILTAGTYATFDPPGSTSVTVEAINSNGEVAGYFRERRSRRTDSSTATVPSRSLTIQADTIQNFRRSTMLASLRERVQTRR